MTCVSAFLPWFGFPDGSGGPNAFALPLNVLFGSLETAMAGPGPVSIGLPLFVAGVVGLITAGFRNLWPITMLGGAISAICASDYMLQMWRGADYQSFIFQTFGISHVLAIAGGVLTIVGVAAIRYQRARSRA
jgi:hypothetical protein